MFIFIQKYIIINIRINNNMKNYHCDIILFLYLCDFYTFKFLYLFRSLRFKQN